MAAENPVPEAPTTRMMTVPCRCVVCGTRYPRWNGLDDQHCSRACYADHYGAYYNEEA